MRTPPPPPPGATTDPSAPATTQQSAVPLPSGPPAGLSADTLYSNGYRDYSTAKYDLALQEFNDYLKYFSTTLFAANAQYYIGDISYKKNDFPAALRAFDAVLERFPDGNKTPDAHYMKALSLLKLDRNDAAATEFRDIVKRYPDTDRRQSPRSPEGNGPYGRPHLLQPPQAVVVARASVRAAFTLMWTHLSSS